MQWKITSCKSTASVFGKYAGGIAGKNSSGKCRIYGCYNEGTIETDGGNAGGIYGKDDGFDFDIKGCYNIGTVQGKQGGEDLGAITSSSSASGSSVMASCYVKENMPLPMLRRKQYSVPLTGLLPQAAQCGTPTQAMTVHTQQTPAVCLPAIISSGNPSVVGTAVRLNILSSGGRSKDVYTLCYRCVG